MNKKMNLSQLRIKSFVTNLENEKEKTIVGGLPPTRQREIPTNTWINCRTLDCPNTRNCEHY